MISKKNNNFSFTVDGIAGELLGTEGMDVKYILNYQGFMTGFKNLKSLHVFVNVLTDIVENIDTTLAESERGEL